MPRSRFMLSSEVILSDAYLSMSAEAQMLNVILNAEADCTGRIIGVQRIARGMGYGTDALSELYENGYLLKTGDGDTYVAHMWVHNKYDKRMWKRMGDCVPYVSGELVFVGDEGKSAYTIAEPIDAEATQERRSNVDEATRERRSDPDGATRKGNSNRNCNPIEKATQPQEESNPTKEKVEGEGEFEGEGADPSIPCPLCGGPSWKVKGGYYCEDCEHLFKGGL